MSEFYNPCEDKYRCDKEDKLRWDKKDKKFDFCNVHVTVNCDGDDKSWRWDDGKGGCQVNIVINCDKQEKKDKCSPC